jgi:hypothetical protein
MSEFGLLYASAEARLLVVCEYLGAALEISFQVHHNEEAGYYYVAAVADRLEVMVRSNYLEDEEGKFFQYPEHSEFPTVVTVCDWEVPGNGKSIRLDPIARHLRDIGSQLVFLRKF